MHKLLTENFDNSSAVDLLITFNQMNVGDYANIYFELAEKVENVFHKSISNNLCFHHHLKKAGPIKNRLVMVNYILHLSDHPFKEG